MINHQLLLFDAGGRVRCSTVGTFATYNGGTPLDTNGLLHYSTLPRTFSDQNLPLRTAVRVTCDVQPGVVAYFSQSLPFTAQNRLAGDEVGAITHYVAGIPRTAEGAIAVAAAE